MDQPISLLNLEQKTLRFHLDIWIHYRTSPSRMTFASNNTEETVFSNCCFNCHFSVSNIYFLTIRKEKSRAVWRKVVQSSIQKIHRSKQLVFFSVCEQGALVIAQNRCAKNLIACICSENCYPAKGKNLLS